MIHRHTDTFCGAKRQTAISFQVTLRLSPFRRLCRVRSFQFKYLKSVADLRVLPRFGALVPLGLSLLGKEGGCQERARSRSSPKSGFCLMIAEALDTDRGRPHQGMKTAMRWTGQVSGTSSIDSMDGMRRADTGNANAQFQSGTDPDPGRGGAM